MMIFDPDKHHRRSIRLKEFDYSSEGAYFVTICTQDKQCLFGVVVDGDMRLVPGGMMVAGDWSEIPDHYPGVDIDEYVVMPNHLHGIILLTSDPVLTLGDVIGRFKSLTTTNYISGVRENGWSSFAGRLWQRNYYEHIIRNEHDLVEIREYIARNPSKWMEDHEYMP
jgi:REP element-mobilizing transposase RayT